MTRRRKTRKPGNERERLVTGKEKSARARKERERLTTLKKEINSPLFISKEKSGKLHKTALNPLTCSLAFTKATNPTKTAFNYVIRHVLILLKSGDNSDYSAFY
ncbi:hypothetical protein M3685_12195 [Heyndrickxia oleronia]|uniref:hypothetical protein n=1 Tax=Heyndrickxia oleronia TaxID=38875 RepID=UPI00204014B3|nr:hypothetical protein [Heyndrickxia oleronia]MCM3454682.1 hypothetical protein [Heyndrickxia oleronia]